jgi:anti-sigma factor RsiW
VTEENGRIHNQVAELLSAYIDDEVTTDERALVEEHLATCASCVYDLATLRQTDPSAGAARQPRQHLSPCKPPHQRGSPEERWRKRQRLSWWKRKWN